MIATENRCFQQIPRHPLTGHFVDAWNPVDYSIQIKELFGNSWGKPLGNPFLENRKTLGPFPSDAHWRTQQPLPVETWVVSNCLKCRLQKSMSSKVRDPMFFLKPSFQELQKSDLYTILEFQFLCFLSCRRLKAFPNVNDETKNIHGQSDHHATQAFNSCSFKSTFSMPPKKTKLCL